MNKTIITFFIANISAFSTCGQGFEDLNFQSPQNLPPPPGGSVAVTNALPGWSVFYLGSQLTQINYDFFGTASPVELVDTNSYTLGGDYSVLFTENNISISQTGLVPASAESLIFDAWGGESNPEPSSLLISLGGQDLSYTVISNAMNFRGQPYNVYGATIPSTLAGQPETLTFTVDGGLDHWFLDDIQFSTLPIPEPGELALAVTGAVLFGFWSRRKTHSRL
jgi:hypothetical protein